MVGVVVTVMTPSTTRSLPAPIDHVCGTTRRLVQSALVVTLSPSAASLHQLISVPIAPILTPIVLDLPRMDCTLGTIVTGP